MSFPSRNDLIYQRLGAEMVKHSANVDGVKEDGRGPLRSIRNSEWSTQREGLPTEKSSVIITKQEEMSGARFI